MNIEELLNVEVSAFDPHENLLAGGVDIAIRDAEIYGTKLVIKRNGKIEHLTPDEMRAHIAEAQE